MNWKAHLRVSDLDNSQKLEATCRDCGHVHFITRDQILRQGKERGFLHLDEIERETICRARGCHGRVRIALLQPRNTSGFVGGIA